MKTKITFIKNFSFNRQRNWHFRPRPMVVIQNEEKENRKVFVAKFLSKRKKFTSPIGSLASSFDEVKENARKAGFSHVKMGKVEVAV